MHVLQIVAIHLPSLLLFMVFYLLLLLLFLSSKLSSFYVQMANKFTNDVIREVVHQAFVNCSFRAAPGYCLSCGAYRDLQASHATVREAGIYINRYSLHVLLKLLILHWL